jgi:YVTN family beta-propeller protein
MKNLNLLFTAIAALFIQGNAYAQTPTYQIVNKISLEGNGGWDYLTVDESSDRLFVSHSSIVQVVDLHENKLVGTIPDTKGVHGITLANDLNKGFISNGKDTSVTVFDLKTLNTLSKIKITGINPDAILYDKFSQKVFVFNGKTNNATVIDANTNQVISTIPFDGKPEFSVTDENGKIFVNIEDKNSIAVIDTKTMKVIHTWSIAPGEEPTGLAIDNKTHRLFSVCGNKWMMIMNAENGDMLFSFSIGDHCDGVVFDPETSCIYTSNGEGTMNVFKELSANSFKGVAKITTQKGAKTIALNKKTHHVYLPTAEYEPTPEATPENPKPRAKIKAGTFMVLDIAPIK